MGELELSEKFLFSLKPRLLDAVDAVNKCLQVLESHNECYYKAVRRGDIEDVPVVAHRVMLGVEEVHRLQQLREVLSKIGLNTTEEEGDQ